MRASNQNSKSNLFESIYANPQQAVEEMPAAKILVRNGEEDQVGKSKVFRLTKASLKKQEREKAEAPKVLPMVEGRRGPRSHSVTTKQSKVDVAGEMKYNNLMNFD